MGIVQVTLEPLVVVGPCSASLLATGCSRKISLSDFTTCIRALQAFKDAHKQHALVTWENEGGTNWVTDFARRYPSGLGDERLLHVELEGGLWFGHTTKAGRRSPQIYEEKIYPLLGLTSACSSCLDRLRHTTRDRRHRRKYPLGNRTYCYNGTFYFAPHGGSGKYGKWAAEDQG